MEDAKKKASKPQVDEAYLMSVIAEGTRKPDLAEPSKDAAKEGNEEKSQTKERTRSKKISDVSYGQQFLDSHTMTRRGEKCIYIRQEHHERLSRIVQVIGEDKIPLYAYLDNILEHHFEQFEKAIIADFNEKYKPIF